MYNRRAFWHDADAMASFQERRQTIRIATNGQLNVQSERPGPALRLVDVGPGGFGAHAAGMLPIGAVANYRFTTPNATWTAIFRAKIVYCRPEIRDGQPTGGFVAGFSFVSEQPPSIQQQLGAMLDLVTGSMSFS